MSIRCPISFGVVVDEGADFPDGLETLFGCADFLGAEVSPEQGVKSFPPHPIGQRLPGTAANDTPVVAVFVADHPRVGALVSVHRFNGFKD